MRIVKNNLISKFLHFQKHQKKRVPSKFFKIGFHGDEYLISVVDKIMQGSDSFVETGTNVGSTLAYVAKKYPNVKCFSCEPDVETFQIAEQNTCQFPNVELYNLTSQDFFSQINQKELFGREVLFWLDAHGYGFQWPLREEIQFITTRLKSAYILIDDFKVPGLPRFGYDRYDGQICSFEYIYDALSPHLEYTFFYPNYKQKTSEFHALRGWILIEFGHKDLMNFPPRIATKIGWETMKLNYHDG